jgi:hypothetical protein
LLGLVIPRLAPWATDISSASPTGFVNSKNYNFGA